MDITSCTIEAFLYALRVRSICLTKSDFICDKSPLRTAIDISWCSSNDKSVCFGSFDKWVRNAAKAYAKKQELLVN